MNNSDAQSKIEIRFKDNNASWEQITELLHAAYKTNADNGMNFAAARQTVEQTIERVGDGCVLLAFDDDKLIGTITCRIKTDGKRWYEKGINGYLSQLAVLPDNRKNGIGVKLLQSTYEYFKENNAQAVILDTSERAEGLINYYKRQGFVPVDYVHWKGTNYNSIVFKKALNIELDNEHCEKMFNKAKMNFKRDQRIKGLKAKIKGILGKK